MKLVYKVQDTVKSGADLAKVGSRRPELTHIPIPSSLGTPAPSKKQHRHGSTEWSLKTMYLSQSNEFRSRKAVSKLQKN